jgi:8-oxo-dGTP pyrophosphatase MutT (NUDIX family)
MRATVPPWFYRQSAVIPFRRRAGAVDVLMVTSRSGRRWIVPKGIIEPDLSPADSAANEAWEEAGVRGSMRPGAVGTYQYQKWGGTCTVEVFALDVERLEDAWPEQDLRQRRWVGLDEAAELVREEGLAAMIRALGRARS